MARLPARPPQPGSTRGGGAGRLHAWFHPPERSRTGRPARAAPRRHLESRRNQELAAEELGLVHPGAHQPGISAGPHHAPDPAGRSSRVSTAVRPAPARPLKPARPPWIPLFPTLWPSMVRPRVVGQLPFPLNHATRRDFMFARYGILAIAQALALEGREVLFPAFFHCVELEALLAAGARVKFFAVDSNLRIDPENIASRIGPRTAALYVIHYAGFPAPIRELRDLCRDAGLALIEDCAHALLSSSDAQPLGSFGDAAAFSLPKSVPSSDGGVAVLRAGWPQASGSGTR